VKSVLLATALCLATFPAVAQNAGPAPEVLDQIVLSDRLIAAGAARSDPILILAGIKLRAGPGDAMGNPSASITPREAAFAAARTAAVDDTAILGLIDDAEAEGSRRMPICCSNTYGGNYCY
jgi:hypothetical protein